MDDLHDSLPPESLTDRELEVLRLVALGLSNREISDQLVVAHETVRWYTKQIYSKLGAHGRVPALIRARELGLLDPSSSDNTFTSTTSSNHNLPTTATLFIGRIQEINNVKRLLNTSRLLTLTGPGGTGKTRLALQVASEVINDFADGVYFVDLAPLTDATLVARAVASAIGIEANTQGSWPNTLKRMLASRNILLLIDNFEQVIDAAPLVSELLVASPRLKVLATSREALHLSREQEYPVPPLGVPGHEGLDLRQIADSEAVSLFVQRVQMILPDFEINPDNALTVAQICIRLDGLPLAIELAAARSKLFSPPAMLVRLDNRLTALTGGMRDAPQRQKTLRDTLEWSYNLLDEGEKILFARLGVFRGGGSLEAIETVCGTSLPIAPLDGLESLIYKSLVQRKETQEAEPRFVMLETIHEYACECLEAHGEGAAVREAYSTYFAQFLSKREGDLKGKRQQEAGNEIETDFDNLREAWFYTVQQAQIELLDQFLYALNLFAYQRKPYTELIDIVHAAVATLEPEFGQHQVFGRLLVLYGQCLDGMGQYEAARNHLQRALSIAHAHNDVFGIAQASLWLAREMDSDLSKRDEVWQLCKKSVEIFQALGEDYERANALHYQGYLLWDEQKHQESLELNHQVLEIRRGLGDEVGVASSLYNIVGSLYYTNPAEAEIYGREALMLYQRLCQPFGLAVSMCRLATIELNKGDIEVARQYAEDSLHIARENGFAFVISDALTQLAWIDIASDRFDTAEAYIDQDETREDEKTLTDHALLQSLICLGLGDLSAAKRKLAAYLQRAKESRDAFSIVVMGLIAAAEGRTADSVELMSRAINKSTSLSTSYRIRAPLVVRYHQAIRANLDEAIYAAAWERGKALDEEVVIHELIKEQSG